MKMNSVGHKAQTEGMESNAFGFEVNAKMYSLMVDKLYKDKPAAVIRELSCNAYDSHIAAGCPEKPFDIKLPSWLDLNFYIRDYGTGIPHSEFEDIYTNVGRSTKSNSNDQIGSYGLGSKVPFAVTETFVVDSYHEGEHSSWLCFKDEGFPQVSLVTFGYSDEPSGLKVSFMPNDTLKNDIHRLTDVVAKQLAYFPVKPNVIGESIEWREINPTFYTDGYSFGVNQAARGYRSYYEKHRYVVMGNVAYPIDLDSLGISSYGSSHGGGQLRDNVLRADVSLLAQIGEVDVTPSRESLEMTEKTRDFILAAAEEVVAKYETSLRAEYLLCDNLFKLRKLEATIQRELFDPSNLTIKTGNGDITYGHDTGRELSRQLVISEDHALCCNPTTRTSRMIKVYRGTPLSSYTDDLKIYIDDLGMGGTKHYKENASKFYDTSTQNADSIVFLKLRVGNKKAHIDADAVRVKKMLETQGFPSVQMFSEVIGPVVKKAKVARTAKSLGPRVVVGQCYSLTVGGGTGGVNNRGAEVAELPTKGYYLVLKGSSIQVNYKTGEGMLTGEARTRVLNAYACLPQDSFPIYLVREKTVPEISGLKDIETLRTDANVFLKKHHLKTEIIRQLARDTAAVHSLVTCKEFLAGDHESLLLVRYYEKLCRTRTRLATAHMVAVDNLLDSKDRYENDQSTKEDSKLAARSVAVRDKYEALVSFLSGTKWINGHRVDSESLLMGVVKQFKHLV